MEFKSQKSKKKQKIGEIIDDIDKIDLKEAVMFGPNRTDSQNYQINIIKEKLTNNKSYTFLKTPETLRKYKPKFKNVLQKEKKDIPSQISYVENRLKDKYFDRELVADLIEKENQDINLIKQRGNCLELLTQNPNLTKAFYYNELKNQLQISDIEIQVSQENENMDQQNEEILDIDQTESQTFNLQECPKMLQLQLQQLTNKNYINFRTPFNIQTYEIQNNDKKEQDTKLKLKHKNTFYSEKGEFLDLKVCKQFPEIMYTINQENKLQMYQEQAVFSQSQINSQNKSNNFYEIASFDKPNVNHQIISIDTTHHPKQQLLSSYNQISLYDQRIGQNKVFVSESSSNLPYNRFFSIKHLQDQYFMSCTSQFIQIYDLRSPKTAIQRLSHFMDDCVPYISTSDIQIQDQQVHFQFSPEKNGSAFLGIFDIDNINNNINQDLMNSVSRLFSVGGKREQLQNQAILKQQGVFTSTLISDIMKVRGVNGIQIENSNKFLSLQVDNLCGISAQIMQQDQETNYFYPQGIEDAEMLIDYDPNEDFITKLQYKKVFKQPKSVHQLDINDIEVEDNEDFSQQNANNQQGNNNNKEEIYLEDVYDKPLVYSDSDSDNSDQDEPKTLDARLVLKRVLELGHKLKEDKKEQQQQQQQNKSKITEEFQYSDDEQNPNQEKEKDKNEDPAALEQFIFDEDIENAQAFKDPKDIYNKDFIITPQIIKHLKDLWK